MREIRSKAMLAVTAVLAGSALALAAAQTSSGAADDYYCSGTSTVDAYCTPTTTGTGGTTTSPTRTTSPTDDGEDKGDNGKKGNKKNGRKNRNDGKKGSSPKDKKVKVGNVKKSGIGDAKLNEDENKIEKRLGDPKKSKNDYLEYKAKGGGKVILGLDGKESEFVGTDSKKAKYRGIEVGDTAASAEAELGDDDKMKGDLLLVKKGKSEFVVGLGGGDVEVLGVADKKASDKDIKDFVKKVD